MRTWFYVKEHRKCTQCEKEMEEYIQLQDSCYLDQRVCEKCLLEMLLKFEPKEENPS